MLTRLSGQLLKIERFLVAVAGTALLMMVLVVVFDIAGRTLGTWNLLSTVEQTTLYMMILGFLGLSRCFRNEQHIVVDLVTSGLSKATIARIDAIWAVVTALILLPLAYLVIVDGLGLHAYGRRSEILGISPLVHHVIAGVGFGAAALVALSRSLQVFMSETKHPPSADGTPPSFE